MATAHSTVGDHSDTRHATGLVVLIMHDRPSQGRYGDILKSFGFMVRSANDGESGLDLLRDCCPKLLILGTSLPDVDGIDICREARELYGDQISIVFVSEIEDLGLVESCLQAGGNDYIFASDDEMRFSESVHFWATARPIHRRPKHRSRTLAAIRAAAHDRERKDGDANDDAGTPLSSRSDSDVAMMAAIVERARNAAGKTFGHTANEKLCLLGYITGIIDHWATIQSHVMTHRPDYLRAALRETEILSNREIEEMLAAWEMLAQNAAFSDAVKCGIQDAISCEVNGRRYSPTGLTLIGPENFAAAEFDGLKQTLSNKPMTDSPGGHRDS